jgi:hypothetical protein
MTKRRTAAEIIAFHFGWDITDVRDCRYQPTRYTAPAIFTIGDDYYCAPTKGQKLPKGWAWTGFSHHYGRDIYCAPMNAEAGNRDA